MWWMVRCLLFFEKRILDTNNSNSASLKTIGCDRMLPSCINCDLLGIECRYQDFSSAVQEESVFTTDRLWSGKTMEKPNFEGRKEGDNIEVDDDKEDQSVNQVTATLSGVSLS